MWFRASNINVSGSIFGVLGTQQQEHLINLLKDTTCYSKDLNLIEKLKGMKKLKNLKKEDKNHSSQPQITNYIEWTLKTTHFQLTIHN